MWREMRIGGLQQGRRVVKGVKGRFVSSMKLKNNLNRFGYEFSNYLDGMIDVSIVERSLKNGSNIFYGNSEKCHLQFERLHEISTIDEFSLDSHFIGCHIPFSASAYSLKDDQIDPQQSLQRVQKALGGRALNFVTTSLHSNTYSTLDTIKNTHPTTETGIEITTNFLLTTKDVSSEMIVEHLEKVKSKQLLDVLVLSANPFTNHLIHPILSWGNSNGIPTIASDVFRGHPVSPGLFLSPSVSRQRNSTFQVLPIDQAIASFKQCLDVCGQLEKKFLDKLPNKEDKSQLDQLKPIFLALTLANSQHRILYAEEWEYLKAQHVAPNFEKAIKEFKKEGTAEHEDFATLYVPMRNNLIRAFETVLFARQELVVTDLQNNGLSAVNQAVSSDKSLPVCFQNDPLHVCVMKSWNLSGFKHVLGTGVDILSSTWNDDMNSKCYSINPKNDCEMAKIYLEEVSKNIQTFVEQKELAVHS